MGRPGIFGRLCVLSDKRVRRELERINRLYHEQQEGVCCANKK